MSMRVKNNMFGILLHVFVKVENIYQTLWMIEWLRVMKLQSHTIKQWKPFQQILMKRK